LYVGIIQETRGSIILKLKIIKFHNNTVKYQDKKISESKFLIMKLFYKLKVAKM
jgi:hypothetical protein